jgi:excisionase family DNA binding protein
MKAFYRVSEVGEILNMGRTKVYQLIRAGVIPSTRILGSIRVPAKPLHDWIDSQIASGNAIRLPSAEHL